MTSLFQISRILSILANLNSAVVRIVSILPLISSSKSLFQAFGDCSKNYNLYPITFMFHSLFSFLAQERYLSFQSFIFTQWSVRIAEFTSWQVFCLLINWVYPPDWDWEIYFWDLSCNWNSNIFLIWLIFEVSEKQDLEYWFSKQLSPFLVGSTTVFASLSLMLY